LLFEALAEAPKSNYSISQILQQIAAGYIQLEQPHRSVAYLRQALAAAESAGESSIEIKLLLARELQQRSVDHVREAQDLLDPLVAAGEKRAFSERAMLLQAKDDCPHAVPDFSQAIENDPADPSPRFFRAACYETMGNLSAAEDDIKKVVEMKPSFTEGKNFLAYMYALQSKELGTAQNLSEGALDADPDNAAFQDTMGWVFYQQENYERARYHLQFAARLMEESGDRNAEIYDHLGDTYSKLQDKDRAIYNYDQAFRLLNKKTPMHEEDNRLKDSVRKKLTGLGMKE
jgi:tetratricopeptide (TPR) repeat protein